MRLKELTPSAEDYLKTIRLLSLEKTPVREILVAKALGVSKPSVTRAVGRLKTARLLTVRGNILRLTSEGERAAREICERFSLLLKLLISLGVPAETAQRDACKMEHGLSYESANHISRFFMRTSTCPAEQMNK